MSIEEQIQIAKESYSSELEKLNTIEYPIEYTLFACKWIYEAKISHKFLGWCLREWKEYVKDKEDIFNIIDVNDLVHTIGEYRIYGHRNLNRQILGLCKYRKL